MQRETFERDEKTFTKSFLGKCTARGCKCVVKVEIQIKAWTETHFNHAGGFAFPARKSRRLQEPSACQVNCREHRTSLRYEAIEGRYSEKHICDARCTNAKGGQCDCQCGGANHGGGHNLIKL